MMSVKSKTNSLKKISQDSQRSLKKKKNKSNKIIDKCLFYLAIGCP